LIKKPVRLYGPDVAKEDFAPDWGLIRRRSRRNKSRLKMTYTKRVAPSGQSLMMAHIQGHFGIERKGV